MRLVIVTATIQLLLWRDKKRAARVDVESLSPSAGGSELDEKEVDSKATPSSQVKAVSLD